jgi:hypothetical protein
MLFDMIAPELAQKLTCQELVGKCSEAVLENGVRSMSQDQEVALDKLLRAYEDQLNGIELQAVAGMFYPQTFRHFTSLTTYVLCYRR